MGIVQKDAIRTTIISYLGLVLGYFNKGFLFVIFLTTDQIGLLSLILSIALFFAQFSNLGVSYTVWKFFPYFNYSEKQNYGFNQLKVIVNIVGITLFSLLYVIFKNQICELFINKSAQFIDYYYWVLPLGIFYSLFLTLDSIVRSLMKNVVSIIATELILRVITLLSILLYALKWLDFFDLVVIQSLSYALPFAILLFQLQRNRQFFWRYSQINIPRRFKKILINYTVFSYFNFLGIFLVTTLDTIMVASMLGLSETGIYTTLIFVVSGVLVPYKSLLRICYPLISKFWKERNVIEMKELYTRVSSLGLFFGLVLFLGLFSIRDEVAFILPKQFIESADIVAVLMIGRVVDMYCGLNGTIFILSKKYKYDLYFTSLLVIGIIVFNLVLIPKFGIYGAALSNTLVYVIYNICRLFFVWIVFKMQPFQLKQIALLSFFILTLLLILYLPLDSFAIWIRLILRFGIILIGFLIPIIVFKLEQDSVDMFKKIVRK